jgi:hypothetical protein
VAIRDAQRRRDTVGGVIEVVATGVPPGLGSHVQSDRKLDGRLGGALLSIQAIKAVEVGDGFRGGRVYGSEAHDPVTLDGGRLARTSNHAGGLEGGITNGEPVVLRAVMKPIATVPAALPSGAPRLGWMVPAHVERSDPCAVPAAGVVTEAVVAMVLADALLEALGGDTLVGLRHGFARMRLSARVDPGHVWLVGPMGSGKTEAGRRLAVLLGVPFVDLDAVVEARAWQRWRISPHPRRPTSGRWSWRRWPREPRGLGGGGHRRGRVLRCGLGDDAADGVVLPFRAAQTLPPHRPAGGIAAVAREDPGRQPQPPRRRRHLYARADARSPRRAHPRRHGGRLAGLPPPLGPLAAGRRG